MTSDNSDRRSPGFWANLFNSFRIAWKLMWDGQVPLSAKIVPVIAIIYILSPIDILPDLVPGLGQLDDVAILLLGVQAFIALSPQDIVKRIRAEIEGRPSGGAPGGGWNVTGSRPHDSDQSGSGASHEIIDG
jgi:uncharacterized membrane protein YkvA (DUF1232 family)